MASATYFIEVDWDNNGDFVDAFDDITDDVLTASFSRGKESELDIAEVGRLELRVKNADAKYSPWNVAGDLYGKLLPKRPIRLRTTDPVTVTLFYGYIEEIIPHPHLAEKDCYISAVDGLDYLARHELDTVLTKDALTGALVTVILDAASWPAGLRTLDAGQDTVPYGYWSKVSARYALQELEESERSLVYVDGSGNLVYEDRHHRWSATHQTSQATFTENMVQIYPSQSAKYVFNEVRATVTPWEIQGIAELWRLEEVPVSIDTGQSKTWWANFDYFADTLTSPVATTDYTANSEAGGGGDDETGNVVVTFTPFAQSAKIAIQNNAGHIVYITLLKVRGTYYDDQTKVTRKAEDATSQTAYQKRTFALDAKFMTDAELAESFCQVSLARYKDPQPEVAMVIINKNATNLLQILTRVISDRITVVNSELGLNQDFFINKVEHEITEGGLSHTVRYTLVDATNEDFWVLDYSALGTGTKLGY